MGLPIPASDNSSAPEQSRWFTEEVHYHEAALRSWLRNRFPTLTDIDDLVQESYARLIRANRSCKLRNPRSYLFSTARNAAIDLFRRDRIVRTEALVSEEGLSVLEERPCPAETLTRGEELEMIRQAIDALPPRCGQIMMLQKIEGLAKREIAQRLGISINTVNAQLVIGIVRCREYLRTRGVLESSS